MRNVALSWALAAAVVIGCATVKPVLRTVADLASLACENLAAQNKEQLQGLSAKDWCAIERNLQPFIDGLLAAQQQTGLKKDL